MKSLHKIMHRFKRTSGKCHTVKLSHRPNIFLTRCNSIHSRTVHKSTKSALCYNPDRSFTKYKHLLLLNSKRTSSQPSTSNNTDNNDNNPLPIIITEQSVQRINELKKKRNDNDIILRVAVSSGGCVGFQYEFELVNKDDIDQEDDIILVKDNAQFVIDKISMKFIKGSKLDFVSDFIQTSFTVIDNPNIVSECGCNISFAPNPDLLSDD